MPLVYYVVVFHCNVRWTRGSFIYRVASKTDVFYSASRKQGVISNRVQEIIRRWPPETIRGTSRLPSERK